MERAFLFYPEWRNVAKKLNEKERAEFLEAVIDYGVTGKYECNNPVVDAVVNGLIAAQINRAQESYQNKVEGGKNGGRHKSVDDEAIRMLAVEGMSAKMIAQRLGISTATVYHSEGWRARQ